MTHKEILLTISTIIDLMEQSADRPNVTKLHGEATDLLLTAIGQADSIDSFKSVCHRLPDLDIEQVRAVHALSGLLILRESHHTRATQ